MKTGLSDLHKMVISLFKTNFKSQKPEMQGAFRRCSIIYLGMIKNISKGASENLFLKLCCTF